MTTRKHVLDFSDQTVLVAGGAGGIGRAAVELFDSQGADVWVVDRRLADSGPAGPSRSRVVDMTDGLAVATVIEDVLSVAGKIDVAVNAVGWTTPRPFSEEDVASWQRILDINLHSMLLLASEVAPPMQRAGYGRIVAVSSLAGRIGQANSAAYAAAKAGVIGFVKSLARELAKSGVTVNSVAPGAVMTPLFEEQGEGLAKWAPRGVPMGRISDPAEQAAAIVFLASREAGYITGQTLSVDGGLSMI